MMVSSAGVVSWAKPVTGTYTVGVVVKAATGGVGSSNLVVTVAAGNKPPVISTPSLAGVAGAPFSVAMQAIDPDGDPVEFGMSYGPSGLAMSLSGELNWAQPEKGKYIFIVTARDPQGSTSMVAINLTIG
jgi:serine protease